MTTRALVIRYGAYGDMLIALPFIEEMKRRYDYTQLETGERGGELLGCHPAISTLSVFDPGMFGKENATQTANIRVGGLVNGGSWDYKINLWRTLEVDCIAEDWQEEFFWPRERRQAHFADKIFVERPFIKAGIPIPKEFRSGTVYFDTETILWMDWWKVLHTDTFNIAIVVAGSTCQKVPSGLKELARRITKEYPDARIFLIGDKPSGWMPTPFDPKDLQFDFGEKNVSKMVGKTPYRQALAIMKMADYVIGPVSSLLHGAGIFGTPKTMICTDCSVAQACKYHHNDFSVQAQAPCCPCQRAIYNTKYCLTEKTPIGDMPVCNLYYDKERIMEGVAFAHSIRKVRREMECTPHNGCSSIPDFKTGMDYVAPGYGRHGLTIVGELIEGKTGLNIVELGMTRKVGTQYREGYSTPFFAHLAIRDGHTLTSIDIKPEVVELNREILKTYGLMRDNIHLVAADGLEVLRKWDQGPIDVLYLDAWDYDPDDLRRRGHFYSEKMHLKAMKAAEKHIPPGGLVLVDDMLYQATLVGKGTLVIPWLAERGWECVLQGWQVLMRKPL